MSNISREDTLHYIRSVQAVNAISSEVPTLSVLDFYSPFCYFVSLLKSKVNLGKEEVKRLKLIIDDINKLG